MCRSSFAQLRFDIGVLWILRQVMPFPSVLLVIELGHQTENFAKRIRIKLKGKIKNLYPIKRLNKLWVICCTRGSTPC